MLQITGAKSTLTTSPHNTAVLSGNSATFHCTSSSDQSTALSWKFADTLIVPGCSGASAPYSLNTSSAGQCDLIVNDANLSLSGFYRCIEYPSLDSLTAMLTVIGEFPLL